MFFCNVLFDIILQYIFIIFLNIFLYFFNIYFYLTIYFFTLRLLKHLHLSVRYSKYSVTLDILFDFFF